MFHVHRLWTRCCVLCLTLLSLSQSHCSPPETCTTEGVSTTVSLDPTGSPCTKDCECSGQNFEGICDNGTCSAVPREDYNEKGKSRTCRPQRTRANECREGLQTCHPSYLNASKWGNCVPRTPSPENDAETCGDSIDNDCDGQTDKFDPGCKQYCIPGSTEPCYSQPGPDGKEVPIPEGTANKGNCKYGIRTCQEDRTWGACKGAVGPQPTEVCGNRLDDDCNAVIDDGCTLHQSCYSNAECSKGELCIRTTPASGFCFQSCAQDSICTNNLDKRTRCLPLNVYGSIVNICAEEVPDKTFCDINRSKICKDSSSCYQNICLPSASEGGICGQVTNANGTEYIPCQPGLTCHRLSSERPPVCIQPCDPKKGCELAGFYCVALTPIQYGCIQIGCQNDAQCLWNQTSKTKHVCYQFPTLSEKLCLPESYPGNADILQACHPTKKVFCKQGLYCHLLKTDGSGFCTKSCTQNSDCGANGTCQKSPQSSGSFCAK